MPVGENSIDAADSPAMTFACWTVTLIWSVEAFRYVARTRFARSNDVESVMNTNFEMWFDSWKAVSTTASPGWCRRNRLPPIVSTVTQYCCESSPASQATTVPSTCRPVIVGNSRLKLKSARSGNLPPWEGRTAVTLIMYWPG